MSDDCVMRIHEESIDGMVSVERFALFGRLCNALLLLLGLFDRYLRRKVSMTNPGAGPSDWDAVVCYDLILLPLLLQEYGDRLIQFDAREYYPAQFEHNLIWRSTAGRLARNLCDRYLRRADLITTVSDGIADEYRRFGVDAIVLPSYPAHVDLQAGAVRAPIRLVHHGNCTSARRLELMLELMSHLGSDYQLDLFLVPTDRRYFEKLTRLASRQRNVQILPPVPFRQIVPTLNQYDIGLFIPPRSTRNLEYCLPNKLFEYVQARLMVVVSNRQDMSRFVERNGVGIVLAGDDASQWARRIVSIAPGDILMYKRRSAVVASECSFERIVPVWRSQMAQLLSRRNDKPDD